MINEPNDSLDLPSGLDLLPSRSPLGNEDSMALDLAGDLLAHSMQLQSCIAEADFQTAFEQLQKINECSAELMKGFTYLDSNRIAFDPQKLITDSYPGDYDGDLSDPE